MYLLQVEGCENLKNVAEISVEEWTTVVLRRKSKSPLFVFQKEYI